MNFQTITLGDGTVVLITYDTNDMVLQFTSTNPVFLFAVGEFQLNIGTFTTNVIATLVDLVALVYDTAT